MRRGMTHARAPEIQRRVGCKRSHVASPFNPEAKRAVGGSGVRKQSELLSGASKGEGVKGQTLAEQSRCTSETSLQGDAAAAGSGLDYIKAACRSEG
ncbi:hypothetical protein EYF80_038039 [Liparis tanakae]|uniref:Uncharacterized protein n=1 Tax=Liparis tanakae TaxID=230148 RepID=A0A4Z2GDY1_9TELE|nr:hypothetical protein EYF80_038039 [Liparis tanakae]